MIILRRRIHKIIIRKKAPQKENLDDNFLKSCAMIRQYNKFDLIIIKKENVYL